MSSFLEKDYDSVTMDEIAKKSGVSKGTVFYYFESKELLAVEVIETTFEKLLSQVAARVNSLSSPHEKFKHFVKELVIAARSYQGLTKFLLQVLNRVDENNKKRIFERACVPYISTCDQILREMKADNTYLKSLLLVSLFDGLGLVFFLEGDKFSDENEINSLIDEITALFECLITEAAISK